MFLFVVFRDIIIFNLFLLGFGILPLFDSLPCDRGTLLECQVLIGPQAIHRSLSTPLPRSGHSHGIPKECARPCPEFFPGLTGTNVATKLVHIQSVPSGSQASYACELRRFMRAASLSEDLYARGVPFVVPEGLWVQNSLGGSVGRLVLSAFFPAISRTQSLAYPSYPRIRPFLAVAQVTGFGRHLLPWELWLEVSGAPNNHN